LKIGKEIALIQNLR